MTGAAHAPSVREAVSQAERLCARRGLKLTDLRRRALEALAAGGKPMKAYDLLAALGGPGQPAKPATAYRALEFLEELGLVHRVAAINAFVLCAQGGGAHVTDLFICETCGRAEEKLGPAPAAVESPAGFVVQRSIVEHYGLCGDCAEEARP